MLEYWIPFSEIDYTRKLGTWCDGIPLLIVDDISRTAFALAGVGYFPQDFSPFELEFHYTHRRDLLTSKINFRFGLLDGKGHLRKWNHNKDPSTILSQRPSDLDQWAVAVELTPTEL